MPVEDPSPIHLPAARALVRRALGLLTVVAVVGLVVAVLPGLADVRARFNRADTAWLAATFACVLASMLSYVAAVRGTLSSRIGWRPSRHLGMAKLGSNVLLPTGGVGGPALGPIVLGRAGVPLSFAAPRSVALFLLTSAASFAAIAIAGTATGIGLLGGGPSWVATLLPAALAAAVVAAVVTLGHLPVGQDPEGKGLVARCRHRLAALLRDGVNESFALLGATPWSSAAASATSRLPSSPSAPRSRPSAAARRRSARSSWRTPWGRWVR